MQAGGLICHLDLRISLTVATRIQRYAANHINIHSDADACAYLASRSLGRTAAVSRARVGGGSVLEAVLCFVASKAAGRRSGCAAPPPVLS